MALEKARRLIARVMDALAGHARREYEAGRTRNLRDFSANEARAETDTGAALLAMMEEIWSQIPAEEMAKLPADLAAEHDHYIYGTPKRGGEGMSEDAENAFKPFWDIVANKLTDLSEETRERIRDLLRTKAHRSLSLSAWELEQIEEKRAGIPDIHEHLLQIVVRLPEDYEPLGQQDRWIDPEWGGSDCSCGCRWFAVLECMPLDWGVCMKPGGYRQGLLTFEHQAGKCFESEPGGEQDDAET